MNRLLQLLDMCKRMGNGFNAKATMVFALLMMASGSVGLRAQTIAGGIYYISHDGSWYLWPSVVQSTGTTNEYLTTFNATDAPAVAGKYDAHDNTYCHWVVKNVENVEGAFQLINPKLNKYIVRRGFPKTNTQNNNAYGDRDIWLMENPTGDDLTRSYFYLHKDDKSSPYRITFDKSQNYTFNSARGDKAGLGSGDGTAITDQRDGFIQLYAGSPKWAFTENLLPAPTINYDSEANTFTITYDKIAAGFDILYTTDGSTPTVGGSTTQTYSSTVTVTGTYTLKTVVARYGIVLTRVATQGVGIPSNPVISSTADCSNTVEITGDGTIYYTTDGTGPDNTSTPYAEPFAMNEDATIKAIAYNGTLHSDITTLNYTPQYTAKPIISQSGITITITGSGTIYYTTDGSDPTTASTPYTAPITLTDGSGTMTIKAAAKESTKGLSCIAETTISLGYFINDLSKLQGISSHLAERCIVTNDFDASSLDASISGFTGELDGGYHTISGLTVPLFDNLSGGTVKNVILSSVNISDASHAGAVTNVASGSTRIYNCGVLSGSVTSTGGSAGGLVGQIAAGSSVRVVNCYNYATISGSDYAGGIVGKNEGSVGDVRIALCMMYGNMTTGTNRSPVYGGNHTSNSKNFTEYNFWRSKANLAYTAYNDQLAIDKDEYLTRFPFYRHILNTHRELAAFFLFGGTGETVNDITADEIAEIGHWVLKKDVASYPIIEEWQTNTKRTTVDIAANLPRTTGKGAGKLLNDIGDDGYYTGTGTKVTAMGNNGYLTVNLSINGSSYSTRLPITDMDEANFDYTWGKVVLPFANEFSGWTRDYSKVCTGWEITSITGGTAGTFANYNVADRDCTAKDLYENSNYIFAQGGNYIVPYGVTAINATAHFANAFYLSDASYEVGYNENFGDDTSLGGNVPTTYHDQTVYTNLATLVGFLSETTNPHVQAIVLVGNYHFKGTGLNTAKAVTIMSADDDNNQEPDYGWYTANTSGRLEVPALRFDFVPNIEMGMSSRVNSTNYYPSIGIWHARGWFELTETCVSNMTQCEINSSDFSKADDGKGNNRWIANSGCFVQIVRARDGDCNQLSYIQIGGNAYVEELYPGSHTDNARTNTIVPIAVTGGEVKECYMSGYKAGGKLTGDMIRFWCTGGKIGKFLGAYLEEPQTAGLTAKIDHAIIGRFFGGGTSAAARIKGDIYITVNNSRVDFYCGGPEFGDMNSGKTVTTHATGTEFGVYYGAGFGGTSITYNREDQINNTNVSSGANITFPINFNKYTGSRLTHKNNYGIGTCYKFEYIYHSNGYQLVSRFYTGYAQFSLATTGNVTNILNGCTVTGDFYGAGCQGMVDGTVTSTLTDCKVKGNAFGGGYKAESNEVEVYPTTQPAYSVFNRETGIFGSFGSVDPVTFTWRQGTSTDKDKGVDADKILYTGTGVTMTDLGNVTGDISITIGGDSKIGTVDDNTTGSVYGGGNESKSLANTTVTLKGNTEVLGDVFGGGNRGLVEGSATVNITE